MQAQRNSLGSGVMAAVRRPSRLKALAALQANAESSAQALDRITRVACRALDVPVVLVNLIGSESQHFLGCGSLPEPWSSMSEMPLDAGWCPFALEADDAFAFADAREQPELADNPAAQRLGVRAYAGVPLRAPGGEPVGTLCAVDYEPHEWSSGDLEVLADLAASASTELQLLSATRIVARHTTRMQALGEISSRLAAADGEEQKLQVILDAVDRAGSAEIRRDGGAGEPTFLEDREAVRAATGLPNAGSAALLPLVAGDRRLGVLHLCFEDEGAFTEGDREYLQALAGVAALALA